MKLLLGKSEVRRLLNLAQIREVDALSETLVLVPAAYDPSNRPLFDVHDVRRAAVRLFTEAAPS